MDPVLLFNGDDDLLLQRAVEEWIVQVRAADGEAEVNVVDATEIEHLPELRTTSLFGGRAHVVIRGVEAVTGGLKSELEQYLADPSQQATLLLVARGIGRIPKIAKLCSAAGERVDVKRPTDWDDRGWSTLISGEFARLGRKADAAAIAAIRAHAGTDTTTIASQVSSVCSATTGDGTISVSDVEAIVEGQGRATGFAIADAVAERDPAAALIALRGALNAGEAPLALLGALVFRSRQLLQVRAGASPKEAGMSPGQHRRVQALSRAFGPGELAWCHDRLSELDLELKGSELPDDLVLEAAVIELATARTVGRPWNPMAV